MSFLRRGIEMRLEKECERVKDGESKQRQNNNKNVARPEKESEGQQTTVGLRSGSVPPQQLRLWTLFVQL